MSYKGDYIPPYVPSSHGGIGGFIGPLLMIWSVALFLYAVLVMEPEAKKQEAEPVTIERGVEK